MSDSNFIPKPVNTLWNYTFRVPSFQRGYRWAQQEVEDLLCDLAEFAVNKNQNTYLLQPLVVREADKANEYDVLDGQQRLTTLLILLQWLKKKISTNEQPQNLGHFFTLTYSYRNQNNPIDFENLQALENLKNPQNWKTSPDHFFIYKAYQCFADHKYSFKLTEQDRQIKAILENKYNAYETLKEIRKNLREIPDDIVNSLYEYLLKCENTAVLAKIATHLSDEKNKHFVQKIYHTYSNNMSENKKKKTICSYLDNDKELSEDIKQSIHTILSKYPCSDALPQIYDILFDETSRELVQKINSDFLGKNVPEQDGGILTKIYKILAGQNLNKQVKFIWYNCTEEISKNSEKKNTDEKEDTDLKAIRFFNKFNDGKIPLTASDLIKSLFVLNARRKGTDENLIQLNTNLIIVQWDQLEKAFQDPAFVTFAFKPKEPKKKKKSNHAACDEAEKGPESLATTSLDDFFNFVAKKIPSPQDPLPAYRYFQEKYNDLPSADFSTLWQKDVLKGFDDLQRWSQDPICYNYVGWLVYCGLPLTTIRTTLEAKRQQGMHEALLEEIEKRLVGAINDKQYKYLTGKAIDALLEKATYKNPNLLRQVLLLFNVALYTKAGQKFPFAAYYKNKWDLEHVASQKDDAPTDEETRKKWAKQVQQALKMEYEKDEEKQQDKPNELSQQLTDFLENNTGNFSELYQKVVKFYDDQYGFSDDQEENKNEKDAISNMVLLDQETNRSYHNAPFPYKLKCIIEKDSCLSQNDDKDKLILLGTKNAFLHYYNFLQEEEETEKKFRLPNLLYWSRDDREKYCQGIKNTLKGLFKRG